MIILRCPSCQLINNIRDNKAGRLVPCQRCGAKLEVPGEPVNSPDAYNILSEYIKWAGIRSSVLQAMLIVWTVIWFLYGLDRVWVWDHDLYYTDDVKREIGGRLFFWLAEVWVLISLPIGITAVVLLGRKP